MKLSQWLSAGIVLSLLATGMIATVSASYRSTYLSRQIWLKQINKSQPSLPTGKEFKYLSSELIANVIYRNLTSLYKSMAPDGSNGVNALWERKQAKQWHIEAQRNGEELVIGGLLKNDKKAIQTGFKMIDWGFAHQAADGSFDGTAGPFHSTSFFVEAVAHTLLVLKHSHQSGKYAEKIAHYTPLVHRAASWMILPEVWEKGTERNQPYTHRRYLVAAAVGLTGKLTGDRELIQYGRRSIEDGLSLQTPEGINPEKGGYDSSYHMVGVVYAQRWLTYFPDDPLAPRVRAMIERALAWEQTRILPSGKISSDGNTRTAGQETGTLGKVKSIDYRTVLYGFAYWASVTDNPGLDVIAHRIADYYYKFD